MPESIQFRIDLPVSPERVYRAWLDSYEFGQFSGSPARIAPAVGGKYSTHDGRIQGEILALSPFSRIVQSWRTPDFPPDAPDAQVELTLEPTCLGAQLTLFQTEIPNGQSARIMKEWEERTFRPMLAYFEDLVGDSTVDMDG
jgi:uncharacterized protein YndB with AHSA1/START domain